MDEVFGLFPTPFLRAPGTLNARLVDGLVKHFSTLAVSPNKASDNLTHANYALVVEGEEDATALRGVLPLLGDRVGRALNGNLLIIEPIGGAGNLS